MIKTIVLNGEEIRSKDEFHTHFINQCSPPEHYGRNLDALWNLITTDLAGPLRIEWKNHQISQKYLGDFYNQVVEILSEASTQRNDLEVVYL